MGQDLGAIDRAFLPPTAPDDLRPSSSKVAAGVGKRGSRTRRLRRDASIGAPPPTPGASARAPADVVVVSSSSDDDERLAGDQLHVVVVSSSSSGDDDERRVSAHGVIKEAPSNKAARD